MNSNRVYLIATVIAVAVILANQAFIQFWLFQKREDGKLINLGGRQRMLSQRLLNMVLLEEYENQGIQPIEVETVLDDWEEAHATLLDHFQPFFLNATYAEIHRQLTLLNPHMEFVRHLLEKETPMGREEMGRFIKNQEQFLSKMEEIVGIMEKDSQQKLYWIIGIEIVFAMVSLILIYYEITFVFKKINKDLEKKNKFLAESNELLEQYAFLAAHDLKSPTQTILNFTGLLQKKLSDKLTESEEKYLAFVHDAAKRMQMTTADLLQIASINQGKLKLDTIQPRTVIDSALADLQREIIEKKASISIGDLPEKMIGDRHMLHLLFQNLISNGLKFVEENEKPEIHIKYEQQERNHVFFIQDEGIGIDPKQEEQIFKLFQRLHGHASFEGTGIGLSICKKIIEKHEGEIHLASRPGKGSTFQISIPMNLA